MIIKCNNCGKVYDLKLHELQQTILCDACGALIHLPDTHNITPDPEDVITIKPLSPRTQGQLIVEVAKIEGNCPVYKVGDRIVLDKGYRINLKETNNICMPSLAAILPYYNALYHGVSPKRLGLARASESHQDVAYVQCAAPCEITVTSTVTFKIFRAMKHE